MAYNVTTVEEMLTEVIWRSMSMLMLTDIDVVEPDEKSIMTYVSLLYDIFPNVPSLEQSLRDNVSYSSVSCWLCMFVRI